MVVCIGDPHDFMGNLAQNALDWFGGGFSRVFCHSSGLQDDLEGFPVFGGSESRDGLAQREALADQIGEVHQAGIDQAAGLPAVIRAAGGSGRDDQFLVMDQIGIEIDGRAILGQPAKEVDPPADGSQGRALIPGRHAPGRRR